MLCRGTCNTTHTPRAMASRRLNIWSNSFTMKQERKGISSIYGFIMIFLLSMASIQTWSSAVGSWSQLQTASDESHQLEQSQSLERLSLSLSGGNLTVTNDGQVPSTLDYLRLVGPNDSKTFQISDEVAVGGSVLVHLSGPEGAVEVVTSLGNVFVLAPYLADPQAPVYWSGQGGTVSGEADEQIFQNPSEPSVFFLVSGSSVYAFSIAGAKLWTFDAGQGFVTGVMPLSGGDVYVSVGYDYAANAAQLYELGPGGSLISSFAVRLDQSAGGAPSTSVPVSKGVDSQFAFYDGWFYSSGGQVAAVPSDGFPLAATDDPDFYFYQTAGEGLSGGICDGAGDSVQLSSYTPNPLSSVANWTDYFYLKLCDSYPPQLMAASAGEGYFAALYSESAYVEAHQPPFSGTNPYLTIVAANGTVLYDASLPKNGYSPSIATAGPTAYLALPQSDQVQEVEGIGQTTTTYDVGFPASQLTWAFGSLFAFSEDEVKVYNSGMELEKTISFAPLALSSSYNGFLSEPNLHNPSFIPLNSTAYAALLENSTGYTLLVIGKYS